MKKEKIYLYEDVKIEKMVSGGYGLGRLENQKVIMVKNTLPGEIVKVKHKENKKDFTFGRVEEYIVQSPDRIEPLCPLFGSCGGCQYQMLSYENQVQIKQEIIKESLTRIGKLDVDNLLQPMVKSPKQFHYRNKGSFQVFNGGDIGFCKPGTTFPFAVETCFLMENSINEKIQAFKNPQEKEKIAKMKALNIRSNFHEETIDSSIKRDAFLDRVADLNFVVDVDTFFQVNRNIIPLWLEYIKTQVQKHTSGQQLLDLFCGVGIIGQYLSPLFESVLGIEINKILVENGKKVLEMNKISNMQILEKDAALYWDENPQVDTLILNPPRAGLSDSMIETLIKHKPKVLIYSSCNPDTFARDLKLLCANANYIIDNITPFDMFPQTSHAEIVTVLYQK